MIPRQPLPRNERGSALLAALCMAVVLTIALSSYLALCFTSLAMSTRSVMAAHSQEIAEAGVEQAIYASNTGNTTGWNISTASGLTTMSTTMTMTSSGLVATSSNPTPLNFGNGATAVANIAMTYTANFPMAIQSITSQGVVTLPTGTMVSAATPRISRTVTFTGQGVGSTAAAPVFVNAVSATSGKIKFSSGGTVNSYNSNPSVTTLKNGAICVISSMGTTTNGNWMSIGAPASPAVGTQFTATGPGTGTGTVYEDMNSTLISAGNYVNEGYSAVLASQDGSTATATVAIKNAVIDGYVEGYDYSSPSSSNWFSYVTNVGQVVGPTTPVTEYIDPNRILTTQVPYQPVALEPSNLANNLTPAYTYYYNYTNQTTLGTAGTATTVYDAGSGITLGPGSTPLNVVGPVIIIAYSDIMLSGSATTGGMIELTTPTASLQIFQEYGNVAIGGRGIQNLNTIGTTGVPPLAKKVAILDTVNSSGTVTISTTLPFHGVIYFPYMPVTVSSNVAIYGSIVGSSVSFTGTAPSLSYDLALRNPDTTVGDAAFANLTPPVTVSNLVTSVP
jgi:hypothetical protein